MTDPGALMILHRRRRTLSRSAFHGDFGALRAQAIRGLGDALGEPDYLQVHALPRLHPMRLALRATRSWPVVTLLGLTAGVAPASPSFTRERWDMVECLTWPDEGARDAALTSALGRDALASLAVQAARAVDASARMLLRTRVVERGDSGLLVCYALRRRRSVSETEFERRWIDEHGPFVTQRADALVHDAFSQHLVVDAQIEGSPAERLDGVAALGFPTLAKLVRGAFRLRTLGANLALVRDEAGFIDAGRSVLIPGRVVRP